MDALSKAEKMAEGALDKDTQIQRLNEKLEAAKKANVSSILFCD